MSTEFSAEFRNLIDPAYWDGHGILDREEDRRRACPPVPASARRQAGIILRSLIEDMYEPGLHNMDELEVGDDLKPFTAQNGTVALLREEALHYHPLDPSTRYTPSRAPRPTLATHLGEGEGHSYQTKEGFLTYRDSIRWAVVAEHTLVSFRASQVSRDRSNVVKIGKNDPTRQAITVGEVTHTVNFDGAAHLHRVTGAYVWSPATIGNRPPGDRRPAHLLHRLRNLLPVADVSNPKLVL